MRVKPLLFTLFLIVGVWYWQPMRAGIVRGDSMTPTLRNGQVFVLNSASYAAHPPERGDIIALRHGREIYVKRVYAVAGDTVWQLVYPDTPNILIEADSVSKMQRLLRQHPGLGRLVPVRIPLGCVFVLGDASALSYDSRAFGPVPDTDVIGKVVG